MPPKLTREAAAEFSALNIEGVEVTHVLGQGTDSVVYAGQMGTEPVAVKVWRRQPDPLQQAAAVVRFHQEVATLIRFQHPLLLQLLATGEEHGERYLITRRIDGPVLSDRIPVGGLPLAEALGVAADLSAALAEVHRHGFVHRDVKARNVIWGREGCVLIDLGMATRSDAPADASSGFAGTLTYAAPEQVGLSTHPVDTRSDLYSLGVLLYLCATGSLPFDSEDAGQLIQLHLKAQPRPPQELNTAVSAPFSALILELLAKEPENRPRSSDEVLHRVQALMGRPASALPPPFVPGREAVWTTVSERLRALEGGAGQLLTFSGDSGAGKSLLLAKLGAEASGRGLPVLASRCSAEDRPLGVVSRAFGDFFDYLERLPSTQAEALGRAIREAIGPYGAAFRLLSPRFGTILGQVQAQERNADDETRMINTIGDVLLAIARLTGGVVLLMEDAHFMDGSARKLMRNLAETLAQQPILIALTQLRPDSLQSVVEKAPASHQTAVKLLPLEPVEVRTVLQAWLGGRDSPPELARQAHSGSAGNLRTLNDFIQSVLMAGLVTVTPGRCSVDEDALRALPRPATFSERIQQQIDQLTEPLRTFLQACAVEGSALDLQVVGQAVQLAPAEVGQALADAVGRQILEERGRGQAHFALPRFRELLLAATPAARQQELHARLAAAWETHPDGPEATAQMRARHYWDANLTSAELATKAVSALYTAGQQLLQLFVNPQARDYLLRVQELSTRWKLAPPPLFFHRLGEARERLGQQDGAQAAYELALRNDPTPIPRARAHARMAQLMMNARRMADAEVEVKRGLVELGRPVPSSKLARILSIVGKVAGAFFFLRRPGLRYRDPVNIETSRALIELYGILAILNYMKGVRLNVAFCFLSNFYEGARLGPGPELIRGYATFATLLALAGKGERAFSIWSETSEMARSLSDRPTLAHIQQRIALGMSFMGQAQSSERQAAVFFREHLRWALLEDAMLISVDLTWNLIMRGYLREADEANERVMSMTEAALSDNSARPVGGHPFAFGAAIDTVLGNETRALERYQKAKALVEQGVPDVSRMPFFLVCDLFRARELGNGAERLSEIFQRFTALNVPFEVGPLYPRALLVLRGYVELGVALESGDATALQKTLEVLKPVAAHATLATHLSVLEAGARIVRLEPEVNEALAEAARRAQENDNPWAMFELHTLQARLHRKRQDSRAAQLAAGLALAIARAQGWEVRARRISAEFDVHLGRTSDSSAKSASTRKGELGADSDYWKRHLEVLHEVALATSETIDAAEHARKTLDEIIRLLDAERAFLLLADPVTGQLVARAGRGIGGVDIPELAGFSRSIIDRVVASHTPVVVTGSDQGEVSASHSAMVQGLLSIIAVPMMVRGVLQGVVYLDSRVARSVFTAEDVRILTAVSSQIAVAAKAARFAEVEAERRALEKDLALTAAMQTLLLPQRMELETKSYRLASYFQPAAQSGGDWVWFESFPDETMLLILGDVTGHGAGAAMVTAAVAGCYQAVHTSDPGDIDRLINKMGDTVFRLCRGKYTVTLAALHLDPRDGHLRTWSAGAPPVLKVDKDHQIQVMSGPGSPLGNELQPTLGFREFKMSAGERLFFTTDGLIEYEGEDGRMPFSLKRMSSRLKSSTQESSTELRDRMKVDLNNARAVTPQEDDITFVVVDVL